MLFYHGTTKSAAEKIKIEGLRPHRETAFQLIDRNDELLRNWPGENEQRAYLTWNLNHAVRYARFRVNYEAARKGEEIRFGFLPFFKNTDHVSLEKPVVLEYDIPPSFVEKLEEDIQDSDAASFKGTIPKEYLKDIIEL